MENKFEKDLPQNYTKQIIEPSSAFLNNESSTDDTDGDDGEILQNSHRQPDKSNNQKAVNGDIKSATSSTSSVGKSNYILKVRVALAKFKDGIIKWYFRVVSFRIETIFFFLLVLPYVFNVLAVNYMPTITFSSLVEGIIFKVCILLVGLLCINMTHKVNARHSEAYLLGHLFKGEANVKMITNFHNGKGGSKVLKYTGINQFIQL